MTSTSPLLLQPPDPPAPVTHMYQLILPFSLLVILSVFLCSISQHTINSQVRVGYAFSVDPNDTSADLRPLLSAPILHQAGTCPASLSTGTPLPASQIGLMTITHIEGPKHSPTSVVMDTQFGSSCMLTLRLPASIIALLQHEHY